MNRKKRWIAGLSGLLLCSAASPAMLLTFAEKPETKIDIKQTVEEDLSSLDIDVEKYLIDPERITGPVLIAFNETNSEKYKSLVYFYDPLKIITSDIELELIVSSGNDLDHLEEVTVQPDEHQLHYVDSSSDGKIDRYYIDYLPDGNRYAEYHFDYLTDPINAYGYDLDAKFVFDRSGLFLDYSNCLNVLLGNPYAWSWHFDEDSESENWWESFKSTFGVREDTLKDQLFYSFYLKNWKKSEIRSIDLEYKKVLLEGYRYNEADDGNTSEFYTGTSEWFAPNYYAWNENNTATNLNKDQFLGHSLEEIASQVQKTEVTILPEEVHSEGAKHDYTWNKIQNLSAFKTTFGETSGIYRFASEFFDEKNTDYWIINYDSFFYSYASDHLVKMKKNENGVITDPNQTIFYREEDKDYYEYLFDHAIPYYGAHGDPEEYVYHATYSYTFIQEYTFDIRATSMTIEDSNGITRTLPVSVAAVDEEASGGTSTPGDFDETINRLYEMIQKIFNVFGSIGKVFQWIGHHWKWFLFGFIGLVVLRILYPFLSSDRREKKK